MMSKDATPVAESVEVTQADREAYHRAISAGLRELTHAEGYAVIARHRLASYEAGRAEGVREAAEVARRTSERIGGVEIEAMEGDNLAILLCTHFDDVDGEQDDNGWTEAATSGCDQTLKAIAEKYDSAIRALSKEPTK